MTWPLLAGSARKRASCQSPMLSNAEADDPHRDARRTNSTPGSLGSNIATCTGSDTNQMATAWVRKMPERGAVRDRAWPSSIAA